MPVPPSTKFRNFCFTLNNWTTEEETKLMQWCKEGDLVKYAIWGQEVGESGTPHLQGYVELSKKRAFNSIRKVLFGRGHVEKRRGTPQQAADYCKKDAEIVFEHGKISRAGTRSDIVALRDHAKNLTKNVDVLEDCPQVIKYVRGFQWAREQYMRKAGHKFRAVITTVFWGTGGCGKTRRVYEEFGYDDVYCLQQGDTSTWWDGYEGQSTLLIDDFSGWLKYRTFLNICDGHPTRLPIKGAHTYALWERVFITSNTHPDVWYKEHSTEDAEFKRRMTHIERMGDIPSAVAPIFIQ